MVKPIEKLEELKGHRKLDFNRFICDPVKQVDIVIFDATNAEIVRTVIPDGHTVNIFETDQ